MGFPSVCRVPLPLRLTVYRNDQMAYGVTLSHLLTQNHDHYIPYFAQLHAMDVRNHELKFVTDFHSQIWLGYDLSRFSEEEIARNCVGTRSTDFNFSWAY